MTSAWWITWPSRVILNKSKPFPLRLLVTWKITSGISETLVPRRINVCAACNVRNSHTMCILNYSDSIQNGLESISWPYAHRNGVILLMLLLAQMKMFKRQCLNNACDLKQLLNWGAFPLSRCDRSVNFSSYLSGHMMANGNKKDFKTKTKEELRSC